MTSIYLHSSHNIASRIATNYIKDVRMQSVRRKPIKADYEPRNDMLKDNQLDLSYKQVSKKCKVEQIRKATRHRPV